MLKGQFKYKINESKIDHLNPVYWYFIGLFTTDGYYDSKNTRVCIRLRNEDSFRVLNLIKEYFEFTGKIFVYKNVDNELRISSLKLMDDLKSLNLHLPKKELNNYPFYILRMKYV